MSNRKDEEAARLARAAKMHTKIAGLAGAAPEDDGSRSDKPSPGESPRDFIERRMRDLDDKA